MEDNNAPFPAKKEEPVAQTALPASQAIITTQVIICEPLPGGEWRLVTSFKDNYNLLLSTRGEKDNSKEVVGRLEEIKEEWKKKEMIIALENKLSNYSQKKTV